MQSRSPLFADLSDLMTDAFSAAQAAGEEARTVFRAQAERMASELDLVSRDEMDALRSELDVARAEIESLRAEISELAAAATAKPATKRKPSARSTAAKKTSK